MKRNKYYRILQGLGHYYIEKQLNRTKVLAGRHQLGAGCEAVAVTPALTLNEGRGPVLLLEGFWPPTTI